MAIWKRRAPGKCWRRATAPRVQHNGSMTKNGQTLNVSVVPGSGADGLAGISGTMDIVVDGGKHDYSFRYALPD
jgi:hypothetical protein